MGGGETERERESAAAVWGMDVFNEYLKGKQFILFKI